MKQNLSEAAEGFSFIMFGTLVVMLQRARKKLITSINAHKSEMDSSESAMPSRVVEQDEDNPQPTEDTETPDDATGEPEKLHNEVLLSKIDSGIKTLQIIKDFFGGASAWKKSILSLGKKQSNMKQKAKSFFKRAGDDDMSAEFGNKGLSGFLNTLEEALKKVYKESDYIKYLTDEITEPNDIKLGVASLLSPGARIPQKNFNNLYSVFQGDTDELNQSILKIFKSGTPEDLTRAIQATEEHVMSVAQDIKSAASNYLKIKQKFEDNKDEISKQLDMTDADDAALLARYYDLLRQQNKSKKLEESEEVFDKAPVPGELNTNLTQRWFSPSERERLKALWQDKASWEKIDLAKKIFMNKEKPDASTEDSDDIKSLEQVEGLIEAGKQLSREQLTAIKDFIEANKGKLTHVYKEGAEPRYVKGAKTETAKRDGKEFINVVACYEENCTGAASTYIIQYAGQPPEVRGKLQHAGPEKPKDETRPYLDTDIQLSSKNASREFKALQAFLKSVESWKPSVNESFTSDDLQDIGAKKQLIDYIVQYINTLAPGDQDALKAVLTRAGNKELVTKYIKDNIVAKNPSLQTLNARVKHEIRKITSSIDDGNEWQILRDDDIQTIESIQWYEPHDKEKYPEPEVLVQWGKGRGEYKMFPLREFIQAIDDGDIAMMRSKEELDAASAAKSAKEAKEAAAKAKEDAKAAAEKEAQLAAQKAQEAAEAKAREDEEAEKQAAKEAEEAAKRARAAAEAPEGVIPIMSIEDLDKIRFMTDDKYGYFKTKWKAEALEVARFLNDSKGKFQIKGRKQRGADGNQTFTPTRYIKKANIYLYSHLDLYAIDVVYTTGDKGRFGLKDLEKRLEPKKEQEEEQEGILTRAQNLAAKIANLAAGATPKRKTPPASDKDEEESQRLQEETFPTKDIPLTGDTKITTEYVMDVINGMSTVVSEVKRIYKKRMKMSDKISEWKFDTFEKPVADFLHGNFKDANSKIFKTILRDVLRGKKQHGPFYLDKASADKSFIPIKIKVGKSFLEKWLRVRAILDKHNLMKDFVSIIKKKIQSKQNLPVKERLQKKLTSLVRSVMRDLNGKEKLRY